MEVDATPNDAVLEHQEDEAPGQKDDTDNNGLSLDSKTETLEPTDKQEISTEAADDLEAVEEPIVKAKEDIEEPMMEVTNEEPKAETTDVKLESLEQDNQDVDEKIETSEELEEVSKDEPSQTTADDPSIESREEESQESQTTSQEITTSASEKETDAEDTPEEDTLDLSVKKVEETSVEAMEVDEEVSLPLSLSLKKDEPIDQEEPLSLSVKKSDVHIDDKSDLPLNLMSNGVKHEVNGVMTNGVHIAECLDSIDDKIIPKLKELTPEEVLLRERKILKLKARLRQEEMKLVLMKKIKQSQVVKENSSAHPSVAPVIGQQSQSEHQHRSSSKSSHGSHNISSLPASLVDPKASPSQQHRQLLALQQQLQQQQMQAHSSSKSSSHQGVSASSVGQLPRAAHGSSSRHSSVFNPPVPPPIHGRQGMHGHHGPPLGMSSSRSSAPQGMPVPAHSSHRSSSSSGRGAPLGNGHQNLVGFNLHDLKAQPMARSSPPVEVTKQTREQKEAAAKAQLRKQLEKTLLQISPPKAPPPEMHFIPNANNTEFVYYVGLETIVDHITNSPNMNRPPPEPFECVQCGSDFTPVWKWQEMLDPKKGNTRPAVICEACVSGNMKKALTAEHTSRLRKAFVTALQQEKEIEQRIAAGTLSPPTVSSPGQDPENIQRSHRQRERQQLPVDIPVVAVSREPSYREIEREERSLLSRSNHSNSSNELRRHHGRGEQVRDHHHSRVREERETSRHRREQREMLLQQQQEQHLASLAGSLLGAGVVPQVPQPPAAHSSHSSSRSFREERGSRSSSGRGRGEEPMETTSSRQQQQQQQEAAGAAAVNANAMAQAMQQLAAANSLMANMSRLTPVQQQAMILQAQQLLSGLAGGPPSAAMNAAAPFMSMFNPFSLMGAPGGAGNANPAANLIAGLNMTPEQLQRQLLMDLIPGTRNLQGSSGGNRRQ